MSALINLRFARPFLALKRVRRALGVMVISMLTFSGFAGQALRRQSQSDFLQRSIGNQRFENTTTVDALVSVLTVTGVPGGIVLKGGCTEPERYTFLPAGKKLREALNSFVSVDRAYKWEVDNKGTVDLRLISGDPQLLRLRFPKLSIKDASSARQAVDQVLAKPETRKRVRELGLTEGVVRIGPSDLPRPGAGPNQYVRKLSLDLKNVSLRQALNAIVQAHGQAIWAYTEQHCRGRNDFTVDLLRQ